MKNSLFFFLLIAKVSFSQTNEWTWVGGDSTGDQAAVRGTMGVPSTANNPGARVGSTPWTDALGNLWLFGGFYNPPAASSFGPLSDIWKYNTATNEWVWLGGDTTYQLGRYGIQGVASATNMPGGRAQSSSWIDSSGNLWLFGGNGVGTSPTMLAFYNDLWKYNPVTNQWTWVKGDSVRDARPTYGIKGLASPLNKPGARRNTHYWKDMAGNFWIFGGVGYAADGEDLLNDLWKYEPASNNWTWMGGDSTGGSFGVYGTKGSPSSSNIPGARGGRFSWIDTAGNFWLFGGFGGTAGGFGYLNDLWKYNPLLNQWTWMSGDSSKNQNGAYGTPGISSVNNKPGGRNSGNWWTDASGNFWLFGGQGLAASTQNQEQLNDLWRYNPATGEWTWMKGDSVFFSPSNYGTKGVATATNTPGARYLGTSWTDITGNFWLYGGSMIGDLLSDLWRYKPGTSLPLHLLTFTGRLIDLTLPVRQAGPLSKEEG